MRSAQEIECHLLVKAAGTLSGLVLDPEHRPVPGAAVLWWSDAFEPHEDPAGTTRAAPDGSFSIPGLGDRFYIVARAPGLSCLYGLRGDLDEGEDVRELEIRLAPAVSIEGEVVAGGVGVESARVTIDASRTTGTDFATKHRTVSRFFAVKHTAVTDSNGRFLLTDVPERTWNASVRCEGYPPWSGRLVPGHNLVRLAGGVSVRGIVVNETGLPLIAARVLAIAPSGTSCSTQTNDRGEFACAGLPDEEPILVLAHARGQAIGWQRVSSTARDRVRLQLDLAQAIEGHVVRGADPVRDAVVVVESERALDLGDFIFERLPTPESLLGLSQTVTDAQGFFRLGDLYPGRFGITASSGELHVVDQFELPRIDPLWLDLEGPQAVRAVLSGRLTDSRTRRGLEAAVARVVAEVPGTGVSFQRDVPLRLQEDGRYELRISSANATEVVFAAEGYVPTSVSLAPFPKGAVDASLDPERALAYVLQSSTDGPFTVRVLDRQGELVPFEITKGHRTTVYRSRSKSGVLHGLPAKPLIFTVESYDPDNVDEFPIDLSTSDLVGSSFFLSSRARDSKSEIVLIGVAEGAPSGRRNALEDGSWWWLDSSAEVELKTAEGETYEIFVEPGQGDEPYSVTFAGRPAENTSSDVPIVSVPRDIEPVRLSVRAHGYLPFEVDVLETGELPGVIALVRR